MRPEFSFASAITRPCVVKEAIGKAARKRNGNGNSRMQAGRGPNDGMN
jgi:hypothetical protein